MPANIGEFAIAYLIFVFSTTLHEYAHAKVGDFFGSDLARAEGLLTLDPIPHIKRSPLGMLLMPVVSVFFFNWMWPMGWASVPYDPYWGDRNPKQKALMSLAGPSANILLAVLALLAIKTLMSAGALVPAHVPTLTHLLEATNGDERSAMGALAFALPTMMFLNIMLGLFNMLPVPPLDGASVYEGFFPKQLGSVYRQLQEAPMIGWLLFFVAFKYAWYLIEPVMIFAAQAVFD